LRAAIGLGSNLGDRLGYLRRGLEGLSGLGQMIGVSSLFVTSPLGGPEQPDYLNAVMVIDTALSPADLLSELHRLEAESERVRTGQWTARTLDLDLIVYGTARISEETLQLPHPRARERRFVIEPLAEIWPEADLDGHRAIDVLAALGGQKVERVMEHWETGSGRFVSRGLGYVIAQTVLLALGGAALWRGADLGVSGWRWVGLIPGLIGLGLLWSGAANLGSALTPFPAPRPEGALVSTGVYGLVRHPMYGGAVLLLLGAAVTLEAVRAGVVALGLGAVFWFKSSYEERRLSIVYPDYLAYRDRVRKRMIPWVV
jgi:2-amino-4-hydroxy-6-hydroxymethyldihydropteridine diphosphokinase